MFFPKYENRKFEITFTKSIMLLSYLSLLHIRISKLIEETNDDESITVSNLIDISDRNDKK